MIKKTANDKYKNKINRSMKKNTKYLMTKAMTFAQKCRNE